MQCCCPHSAVCVLAECICSLPVALHLPATSAQLYCACLVRLISINAAVLVPFLVACSSPSDGSQVAASAEMAVPVRPSWLGFTRLRLRAEQPLSIGPLDMNFRVKAGGVHGDLPPYEAFPLGGTNSVRGYAEGGVGSGRHFVEGSAELRCVEHQ